MRTGGGLARLAQAWIAVSGRGRSAGPAARIDTAV